MAENTIKTRIQLKSDTEANWNKSVLVSEGGVIKFVEYKDGTVYVKLTGACSNCPLIDNTLESGIEEAIINEIPEVIKVVNE